MKVRFTAEARRELRSIGDYIAGHDLDRARSFIRTLRAKAVEIGRSPLAHRVVYCRDGRELRRRVHADYLIFYVVSDDGVDIVRVIHGARDVDALLGADPFGTGN